MDRIATKLTSGKDIYSIKEPRIAYSLDDKLFFSFDSLIFLPTFTLTQSTTTVIEVYEVFKSTAEYLDNQGNILANATKILTKLGHIQNNTFETIEIAYWIRSLFTRYKELSNNGIQFGTNYSELDLLEDVCFFTTKDFNKRVTSEYGYSPLSDYQYTPSAINKSIQRIVRLLEI